MVAPGLLLALALWLLVNPAFAALAAAAYALAVSLWIAGVGRRVLRAEGARPLASDGAARLRNLAAGLAADLGVNPPALWTLPADRPNALVCRARGPVLALSSSVYEDFTRTELEAVVAHCLARLASRGEVTRASLAAGLGRFAGPLTPARDVFEDVRAAAITRYPPALAAAIEKCEPHGGPYAPLWFVPAGSRYPSPTERAEALREL